ncbi:MAG: FKBP-type peptidyl-prolyl cis-trans isomerase [Terracidiphilus sp.]|nr:FKBP-type peptidyl-prolyl cis-trans isomerase [Terracidiphilus sp.]
MKHTSILLALVATASLAVAQAAHKPATAPKAAATHATATHKATTPSAAAPALPPGVAPVAAPVQTAFALRYQEIAIGTGPLAESNKIYKVAYAGWLASDGRKFDASADHPEQPVLGRDLQPEKNADGSPKTAAGQPIVFPQGFGRVIPGWDQGFAGMHIGGKRRLFIPYQLAYGAAGRPTGDPKDPGIPPKADLIFDIELVDVIDLPAPPAAHGAQAAPAAQPAAAAQPQAK